MVGFGNENNAGKVLCEVSMLWLAREWVDANPNFSGLRTGRHYENQNWQTGQLSPLSPLLNPMSPGIRQEAHGGYSIDWLIPDPLIPSRAVERCSFGTFEGFYFVFTKFKRL